jgi:YHS domain-containing protein
MTWILRFILFIVIFYFIKSLLNLLFGGRRRIDPRSSRRPQSTTPAISGHTAKDPVCGMYVATSLALPAAGKGETLYFCSEKCRDEYLKRQQSA